MKIINNVFEKNDEGGLFPLRGHVSRQSHVNIQNAVFPRLETWRRRIQLTLAQTCPKYSQGMLDVPHGSGDVSECAAPTNKSQGQGQVTKVDDNQRSSLGSVTNIFEAILSIEVDGGIRSVSRSLKYL